MVFGNLKIFGNPNKQRFWHKKSSRFLLNSEWTSQGLNLGPPDYESVALTN